MLRTKLDVAAHPPGAFPLYVPFFKNGRIKIELNSSANKEVIVKYFTVQNLSAMPW
jgi:hypothetical protein